MVVSVLTTQPYYGDGYDVNDGAGFQYFMSEKAIVNGQKMFFRFALPCYPNSVINSARAKITFYQKTATDAGSEYLSIRAHKTLNSPALTDTVEYNRPQTTASTSWTVTWNTSGTTYQTFTSTDFKAVVQEIVNQAGFARANYMTVIMTATSEGGGLSICGEEHSTAAYVPEFTIDWTAPGGIVVAPPTVTIISHTEFVRWGNGTITLQYDDISPDNMIRYQLRSKVVSTATWTTHSSVDLSVTPGSQFTVNGPTMDSGETYDIQARVYDGGEWSAWTPSTPYQITPNDTPEKPTMLTTTSNPPESDISVGYSYVDTEGDPQKEVRMKWRPEL